MSCDFTDEEVDPERLVEQLTKVLLWLLNRRLQATPSPIEQGVVRAPSWARAICPQGPWYPLPALSTHPQAYPPTPTPAPSSSAMRIWAISA